MEKVLSNEIRMIYPMPATVVSCGNVETGFNSIAISWCGNISSNPARIYVAINPSRYSCKIIQITKAFVVNLGTAEHLEIIDYCGIESGRDIDKAKQLGFTYSTTEVNAPHIEQFPVSIVCEVEQMHDFGSEILFIARIHSTLIEKNKIDQEKQYKLSSEIVCSATGYHTLGPIINEYGFTRTRRINQEV